MLADAPAQVLLRDLEGPAVAAGADGSRAQGRVDGDVRVSRPQQPVPRVLSRVQSDERPVAPADRAAFVPVRPLRRAEDTVCLEVDRGDGGRGVEDL